MQSKVLNGAIDKNRRDVIELMLVDSENKFRIIDVNTLKKVIVDQENK